MWLGLPAIRLLVYFVRGSEIERPSRIQFAFVSLSLAAIVCATSLWVPSPSVITAPLVVDYDPLTIVRAPTAGFVETIHVGTGQRVGIGDPLITLRNPKLESDLRLIEADIEVARVRAQTNKANGDLAQWKIEQKAVDALMEQRAVLLKMDAQLSIIATAGGTIVTRRLAERRKTYANVGDELLTIGNAAEKTAVAMVSQSDAVWLRKSQERLASLQIWGDTFDSISTTLKRIEPRATDALAHEAFAANFGGPLSTVNRSQVESNEDRSVLSLSEQHQPIGEQSYSGSQLKLVRPHVRVDFEISREDSGDLQVGQTGTVHIHARQGSLGRYIYDGATRWVKRRLPRTHGI